MRHVLCAMFLCLAAMPAFASERESAYERVMRTNTLRCAYIILPPEFTKDVNTGAYGGLSTELVTQAAKRLNMKVEWVEEVNFQTAAPGLKTGRYDAVCFTFYRYSQAAPVADYSIPLFYSSTGVYVRTDDARFDSGISSLDDPAVTLATIDGEMSQFIAAENFPHAKTLSLPQMTDLSQMLENVVSKKADAAFVNNPVAEGYLKANPGKLKEIKLGRPLRVFSHGFMFPKGEYDLVKMFDLTLQEMHDHGAIEEIMKKYDPAGHTYMRVAPGYIERK